MSKISPNIKLPRHEIRYNLFQSAVISLYQSHFSFLLKLKFCNVMRS